VRRVQSIAEGREIADSLQRERGASDAFEVKIRRERACTRVDRVVVAIGILRGRIGRGVRALYGGRDGAVVDLCDIGTYDDRRRDPRRTRASEREEQDRRGGERGVHYIVTLKVP
jgi:hypothetical protein